MGPPRPSVSHSPHEQNFWKNLLLVKYQLVIRPRESRPSQLVANAIMYENLRITHHLRGGALPVRRKCCEARAVHAQNIGLTTARFEHIGPAVEYPDCMADNSPDP